MASIATELAALLRSVDRPGDFFVSGTVPMFPPRLEVEGVGLVALPLLPAQAEQLVAAAERAPYGRGEETLVDTEVRRTWQIGADRVRIGGKHWGETMETVLARVAPGLGVAEPIAAELYKLLVYDKGSFFVSHRDTEKAPGMFATLVVVLPSVSKGGELIVRHKEREARLDLACDDPSELAFAAFYADCVHEVLPITAGCRLALVYNVLRKKKGPAPKPPSYEREEAKVVALLEAWPAAPAYDEKAFDEDELDLDDEEAADADEASETRPPRKLVYLLEHAYTPAALAFDALKGADAAAAGVLAAAAPPADCDLHLALLTVEEQGAADYTGYSGSGRGRWSDELEAGEVFDRHVTLSEWRRPDGERLNLGGIPVEDEELSPPEALDNLEPDTEEFQEATGNAGASFERTYRRAALVVWPRARYFAVLNQAGLSATLPWLADMVERWAAAGGDPGSALWSDAHELAGHMIGDWPRQGYYDREDDAPSSTHAMLTPLTRLADSERIEAFLTDIVARDGFRKADADAILGALSVLQADRAAAAMERIVAGTAAISLGACGRLLARAAAAPPHGRHSDLIAAAARLVELLSGQRARESHVQPGFVADFVSALAAIDPALADRAAGDMLASPKIYDADKVLIPAVRTLIAAPGARDSAAVKQLRGAALEHLRRRIAEPLEAPKDWSRASRVGCNCPRCAELSRFLADPGQRIWIFKAAEADRGHVEQTIKQAGCDLDTTTDRRGRPYSLVCTKNQASYDRRVSQRKKDLEDLKRLDGPA